MNATARLPKLESPQYDGLGNESITVPCGECGRKITGLRADLLSGLPEDDLWIIERDPETGLVLATCDRCRERESSDTLGEENV